MTLSFLVATLAQLLIVAIIIRAVLSWFPPSRTMTPVYALLADVTNPVLRPIQQRLPSLGGFDLSPLIAILALGLIEQIVISVLDGFR